VEVENVGFWQFKCPNLLSSARSDDAILYAQPPSTLDAATVRDKGPDNTIMLLSLGTILFSFFGLFLAAVHAKSSTGNSVLVLLQNDLNRNNFTIFFDNLQSKFGKFLHRQRAFNKHPERGYDLTFRYPKSDTPRIFEDDIPTFNHIIFFAPDTKCEKITHRFAFPPDLL
jgi:hypothetical protein